MKRISRVAAGALCGWAAARLTGADRAVLLEAPAAPFMSFTPHVAAAAPAGVLLARRAGGNGAAAAAAVAGVALAAVVLPRAIRHRQPEAHGPLLRVLTANLLVGQASEHTVVSLVQRGKADVLFLQELTDDGVTRLKQAGLNDLLPHQMTAPRREGPRGSGIYARFPLGDGMTLGPGSMTPLTARLELPTGHAVDLVCAHPYPPTPVTSRWKVARWRDQLTALPPPADPPRILAGDFNATLDHAHFRGLLRLGYVDAAEQTGNGLVPTWGPLGRPALLTLDHILLDRRCAVLATSVHRLPGSDHRAVYAVFRLPIL